MKCPVCGGRIIYWHRVITGGGLQVGVACYNQACEAESALGDTVAEAASRLGISRRAVERKLRLIRQIWQEPLDR